MARKKAGCPDSLTGGQAFWEPDPSGGANQNLYLYHYWRLTELTISMFEWKGLPDTVDVRYLELALFADGQAIFFVDEALGLVATRCTAAGPYNLYGYPVRRQAFGDNGYTNNDLDESNSVICWNNYLRKPTFFDATLFAQRMADMDVAVDVNVKAQKTPVLIRCPEQQKATFEQIYEKYRGNAPVIFGAKGVAQQDEFGVLQTGAPFVAQDVYDLKVQLNNEYLTRIGVSNMNVTKRERMITEEVQRNMGATVSSRYSPLDMRRKCCEELKALFPRCVSQSCTCDYKEDYRDVRDGENSTVAGTSPTGEKVALDDGGGEA